MTNLSSIVQRLRDPGLCIIPSGGGKDGKHPRVSNDLTKDKWEAFQKKFPSGKLYKWWWETLKPVLWGVVTGEISDVVVVDIDPGADFTIMGELLPHVRTPRGGAHYYFRHPGHKVTGTIGILPKIDIRADGNFVNIVGKNPVTSGEYMIEIMPTPETIYSWDKIPEPILAAMVKGKLSSDEEKGAIRALDGVPEGERDEASYKYASRLFGKGLSYDEVKSLVLLAASRCTPPFPEKEALAKVESASKYEEKPKEFRPLRSMVDVESRALDWLWYPYLLRNKVVEWLGDPGVGKSQASQKIAVDVSMVIWILSQQMS